VAAAVDRAALEGRASVRAATPDRLPLAGPVPDAAAFAQTFAGLAYGRAPPEADPCVRPGLWVLGGLGSRGFTTAPLLGEHVAAWITGAPSPLPDTLAAAVHPAHYLVRSLKRGRGSGGALV
jgi:tRNA 5-methylaminomethyl-2-thiouridine biosynthesis bifunctional protein